MKKSKFLKKSLAMLLALMLVVAMIPLSASAALPEDLKYIYVNDSQVSVDELEVEMSSSLLTSGSVKISTNENLAAEGVELRVYEKGGSVEYATAPQYVVSGTTGDEFAIADYVDVSSDKTTGTVKLELVATENNQTIADNTVLASYTLNIKFVDANTTTNLAVVPNSDGTFGDGVYNAYVKGDEIIVETARHNPDADTNPWTETTQKGDQAYITVKALDGATLLAPYTGVEDTINANNGDKVTVQSQDDKHETTYTVKSVYVDALESFTITAGETDYAGQIKDINNDDVVDTIEVVLPKSVLTAANGDPIPSPVLPVSFESKGNINAEVVVAITGGETKNVKTDGSVSVTFNALDKDDVKGTVTVTRLNGFVQQYNLVVKTEDSTNTAIDYARVNATQATIDGDKISAVLPQKYNGNDTERKSVDLVLYTEDTVSKVVVGGDANTTPETSGEANSSTQNAWKFTGVNTTKAVTIAVYAEDGHFEQYTLTTSMAEQTNTAGMSAIWLGNGSKTYEGKLTGTNEYTITVPYMTTDISSWVVYATPTSGSKVVYNNGGQTDVINGITKTGAIGLDADPTLNGDETTVVALNMADDTIHTDYTVKVVLDSAKSANTLTGLDFTAQLSTNNTDKKVYRALNDENQFHAYVDQQSNGTPDLGNINL